RRRALRGRDRQSRVHRRRGGRGARHAAHAAPVAGARAPPAGEDPPAAPSAGVAHGGTSCLTGCPHARIVLRLGCPQHPLQEESAMPTSNRIHSLLTPENCTVIFIDHQPQMTFGVASIDRQLLFNNVIGLAKSAKIFEVPVILTTVETKGFSGYM